MINNKPCEPCDKGPVSDLLGPPRTVEGSPGRTAERAVWSLHRPARQVQEADAASNAARAAGNWPWTPPPAWPGQRRGPPVVVRRLQRPRLPLAHCQAPRSSAANLIGRFDRL